MQGLAVNLVPALHSHILTLKYSDMGPLLDLPHKKKTTNNQTISFRA